MSLVRNIIYYCSLIFLFYVQNSFAAIDVNKSFSPGTVYPSQESQLTILLQNSALSPVLNVTVTDDFPANIFLSNTPNLINTCGGVVTYSNTATGGVISLSGGIIPAGDGTNPGTCNIKVNTYASKAGSYVNTIEVGSINGEVLGFPDSNTQSSQGTLVAIIQDISVSHSTRLGSVSGPIGSTLQGDELAYHQFILTNPNPVNLTNVYFTGSFDSNLVVYSSGASTTCGAGIISFSGNTVTFSGGTIPAKVGSKNGVCEVNIQVQPTRSTSLPYQYRNSYVVFPANRLKTLEGGTNANASSYYYYLYSGIAVDRYYGPGWQSYTFDINTTDTTTARLRFTNYNTQSVSGFSFNDIVLPPGMTITSITSNSCGGTATIVGGNQLTLTGGLLPANASNQSGLTTTSCDIAYNVKVDTTGTYSTNIPSGNLDGYQYDIDNSNLIVTGNIFEVGMTYSRGWAYQGDTTRVIYTLTNRSKTKTIQNIDLTNNLATLGIDTGAAGDTDPIFKVSNRYNSPVTNCTAGNIIAPVGATTIELQDFVLNPDTSCTVSVEVALDADAVHIGSRTNSIPVGNITYDSGSGVETFSLPVTAIIWTYRAINISPSWTPNRVGSSGVTRLRINLNKYSYDSRSALNIKMNTSLPTGFSIANTPNIINECGGVVIANPGDTSFSLSGASLLLGTSQSAGCSVYLDVKVKPLTPPNITENHYIYTAYSPHGSSVNFSAQDIDGNPFENTVTSSALITIQQTNLNINTEFLQPSINGGAPARVRTTISNIEPATIQLTELSLTDYFPVGVQLYSNVNPTFSDTSGSVTGNCNNASFSGSAGANSISLSRARISPSSVCYFEYNCIVAESSLHLHFPRVLA